ncbi:glycosyltransferase family 9 protein, partial [candidate division KSB1 bacterium]|nr:glycosyltransferase family 9 protein [candidate division KSB1 bacterium]
TKMWLKDYFIALIDRLKNKNLAIFLIGGAADKSLCEEIKQRSSNKKVITVAGYLSILESAALIQKLDLMVTNDSAPLHIANAVKTDVLAIFGPTVRRFGCYPYRDRDRLLEIDLYCRPCARHGGKRCPEGHFRCMKEITPQIVYDSIKAMIKI